MVIISAIVCIYYNVIIAWTLYYFYRSFTWVLPWSHCKNEWNSPACVRRENITENVTEVIKLQLGNSSDVVDLLEKSKLQLRTPSEEFWE